MISSIYLDGVPYELERGETFYIDRDVSKIELFPEIVNYAADDPGISYYLEGFEQAPNIVSQSISTCSSFKSKGTFNNNFVFKIGATF